MNIKTVRLTFFIFVLVILVYGFVFSINMNCAQDNYIGTNEYNNGINEINDIDDIIGVQANTRAANPARLEISKSVDKHTIFVRDGGLPPNQTTVTIKVNGVGYPSVIFNPQDTVFVMDNSDSMNENDNEFKRIEALRLYLENMMPPDDRAAIIKFSKNAELINNHHLTSNYTQLIDDLPALWHTAGLTNLGDAVALANQELITYGAKEDKMLIEILLTDGRPEPPENNVTMETIAEAVNNNIKIYTVGLGEDHDAGLLKWVAAQTGGNYYYAREASELIEIYHDISNQFRNYTAGSDPDLTDSEPMVRDVIPYYISIDPNSFTIKPNYIGPYPGLEGLTKVEWNITKIEIGETWSVSYNLSSSLAGEEVAITHPDSRTRYLSQKDNIQILWFDALSIKVLPKSILILPGPPPPPPPPPLPPPPPGSGFPIPAPPPITSVPIALQPPISLPAGELAAIPAEYLFTGFLGLGVAGSITHKRILKTRQKVAVGV